MLGLTPLMASPPAEPPTAVVLLFWSVKVMPEPPLAPAFGYMRKRKCVSNEVAGPSVIGVVKYALPVLFGRFGVSSMTFATFWASPLTAMPAICAWFEK